MSSDIGVYGLAVMGQNLALNIAEKGFTVSVGNRSTGGQILYNILHSSS
jgi:6-phosphogluconate dehydrogenase